MFVSDNLNVNENGNLTIGGVDTVELAQQYGTPLYVMDEQVIRNNLRRFHNSMNEFYGGKGLVCFASKAFSCLEMCRIVASEGDGLDVVSLGELYTAVKAGFPMEKVGFHGNNKTDEELRLALEYKVGHIIVDNISELHRLEAIAEEMNTVPHLELVQFIESAILEAEPDIVITHHPADTNNDHLQTSMACQEAIRLFQRRPEVKRVKEFWYMEVPSCTEWAINSAMNIFRPNCYVEVGKSALQAKVKALQMYRGVMRTYPHPRSEEYISGLAAYRGGQWGLNYAEAFEIVLREY